ncbi:virulence activator alpha [Ruminococcaceae bacterium R-25]|nr:virulence activator alpha [Ruminococcaceae bacterium R-25]SUQ11525.1 Virulence activator alpha C-term [Oscillospiraceae bacterium]
MAKDRKIDVVILGLLSHEDLTGYDIKKRIDGAISFFWKGSFGSIYPALSAMEESGQIKRYRADDSGSREKILYHITPKGLSVLKQWLKDDQASNELKYETLLKLYFGGVAGTEATAHNIDVFESGIKSELEVLKMYEKNLRKKQDNEDHKYFLMTVLFGIETYEAYLRWCTKAKKILNNQQE